MLNQLLYEKIKEVEMTMKGTENDC